MRPATPALDSKTDLSAYVGDYADRVDGRVGVCLAFLDGADEFDVVAKVRPDRPYTAASAIKLSLVYALYRRHSGELDALDEPHGLAPENRVGGSGLLHLLDGAEPTLRDLARATIAISDNAAANELIDHVGVDAVNETARALGMIDTHLGRKMMTIDDGSEDGRADGPTDSATADSESGRSKHGQSRRTNTTSPFDCVRFYAELFRGDRLSDRATDEIVTALGNQKNVSKFPRYISASATVYHKTGELPAAALDTGIVSVDGKKPLCFAVFADELDCRGDGTDIIAEIGDAVFEWLGNHSE